MPVPLQISAAASINAIRVGTARSGAKVKPTRTGVAEGPPPATVVPMIRIAG
jgi:hypothetical protein